MHTRKDRYEDSWASELFQQVEPVAMLSAHRPTRDHRHGLDTDTRTGQPRRQRPILNALVRILLLLYYSLAVVQVGSVVISERRVHLIGEKECLSLDRDEDSYDAVEQSYGSDGPLELSITLCIQNKLEHTV